MHLHLDCQFGIAGDMLLAALVDAGADRDAIVETLRALPLAGFELDCVRTTRSGVAAMLADVRDLNGPAQSGAHIHDHAHDHDHKHKHGHEHDHHHHHEHDGHRHDHEHGHDHGHAHGHGAAHGHGPHRHLGDLLGLLDSPALPQRARERAARIFSILAEAEATVHGQPIDKVHFHEISGIDTAVDVIGSCVALELLEVDSVSASAPAVGSGMLACEHGIFPIPAPATLEILKSRGIPWRAGGEGERATPTGIALLAGLADSFGGSPEISVTRIGYGAGHKEFADVPNLLRAIIGKPGAPEERQRHSSQTIIAEARPEDEGGIVRVRGESPLLPAEIAAMLPDGLAPDGDRVVEFRFAVDDMTAEAVAFLIERCLAAGALDAYALSATMKKGRPGNEITVLSSPDAAPLVAECIWRESTTFGMRVSERSRLVLSRDTRTVAVLGQKVRIKLGWIGGRVVRRQPEYEDCRAAALATGRPLMEIHALAAQLAAEMTAPE